MNGTEYRVRGPRFEARATYSHAAIRALPSVMSTGRFRDLLLADERTEPAQPARSVVAAELGVGSPSRQGECVMFGPRSTRSTSTRVGEQVRQLDGAGQIVILRGPPRSGKSSIAVAIQARFDGLWMNLGVDHFKQMTPARFQPGIGLRPGGERPDLEPVVVRLYRAMYEAIATHSRLGINVVVDAVHHDSYSVPRQVSARAPGNFSVERHRG